MPAKTLLLLVEGPHDLEFCAQLLKPLQFERIRSFEVLKRDHSYWKPAIPEKWPRGDDLLARHPVPTFFAKPDGQTVAIVAAAGVTNLAKQLGLTLANLHTLPDAVGFVLDADGDELPQQRYHDLCSRCAGLEDPSASKLEWPTLPGEVRPGPPKTGIFVLPDNHSPGVLEDLVLDAAAVVYPQLLIAAQEFVAVASQDTLLEQDDLKELKKPAGPKKARTAAMAGILKPGRAIQVSLQDNRWLGPGSLHLPRIKTLHEFLRNLLA